ncbi:MAG: PLP-dependent aminotransferase family protein [Opitutales bacterium]|nr:PLP-dependent aminotransferase family protein [Opitutales bacterium]
MTNGRETGLRLSATGQLALREEPVITRLMTAALERPELLSLAAGFTDNARLPAAAVERAVAALRVSDPGKSYLQYGRNAGDPALREALAGHMRTFPGETLPGIDPGDIVVTNGSQQLLYMTVQLFCDPGDCVWVQAPSYFVFLELLRGLGVRAVSMPVTPDGTVDAEGCRRQLQQWRLEGGTGRPRLAYLMGAFANPSTRSLAAEEKTALAEVFRSEAPELPVVEDMAYRELYFGAAPAIPSMLSMEAWRDHPVLYAGTLTKPFATGLKIGYGVTRSTVWREGLERIKGHQDFGSSQFAQALP